MHKGNSFFRKKRNHTEFSWCLQNKVRTSFPLKWVLNFLIFCPFTRFCFHNRFFSGNKFDFTWNIWHAIKCVEYAKVYAFCMRHKQNVDGNLVQGRTSAISISICLVCISLSQINVHLKLWILPCEISIFRLIHFCTTRIRLTIQSMKQFMSYFMRACVTFVVSLSAHSLSSMCRFKVIFHNIRIILRFSLLWFCIIPFDFLLSLCHVGIGLQKADLQF